jgi:hypothetical protein
MEGDNPMLSGLGAYPKPFGGVVTPQAIGRRFDAVAEQLAAAVGELATLREQLASEFDRDTIGGSISDIGIAVEECLGLASHYNHATSLEVETPAPDVCVEKPRNGS